MEEVTKVNISEIEIGSGTGDFVLLNSQEKVDIHLVCKIGLDRKKQIMWVIKKLQLIKDPMSKANPFKWTPDGQRLEMPELIESRSEEEQREMLEERRRQFETFFSERNISGEFPQKIFDAMAQVREKALENWVKGSNQRGRERKW